MSESARTDDIADLIAALRRMSVAAFELAESWRTRSGNRVAKREELPPA